MVRIQHDDDGALCRSYASTQGATKAPFLDRDHPSTARGGNGA